MLKYEYEHSRGSECEARDCNPVAYYGRNNLYYYGTELRNTKVLLLRRFGSVRRSINPIRRGANLPRFSQKKYLTILPPIRTNALERKTETEKKHNRQALKIYILIL